MIATRRRFWSAVILAGFCGFAAMMLSVRITSAQKPVPHPMVNESLCRSCHEQGKNDAPIFPEDHVDYNVSECLDCHAPNAETAPNAPLISHPLVARADCLRCHGPGIGGAPVVPQDHEGRENDGCQVCHWLEETRSTEPVDVAPVTTSLAVPPIISHPTASGENQCVTCHEGLGGAQATLVADWQHDIHATQGVSCEDCHGGDPNTESAVIAKLPDAGYVGVPDVASIPGLCASCHASPIAMRQYDLPTDQYAKYQESVHGKKLYENGDPNVATCVDCHGAHGTLEVNDPAADVYPSNVPALCASCHADATLMTPYGIKTDQYDLYQGSVHGIALLEHQDLRAPSCATCHGTHGAAPPGFEEVPNVCGSCHSATQNYYVKSPHAEAGFAGPRCVTCHGRYDVQQPDENIFVGTEDRHCGSCHAPDSEIGVQVVQFREKLVDAGDKLQQARELVDQVARSGIIVVREEELLLDARTSLISARAAQHQADLEVLSSFTEDSVAASEAATASSAQKLQESLFRRQSMAIAVLAIAVTIGALFMIKRDLDRRLDE